MKIIVINFIVFSILKSIYSLDFYIINLSSENRQYLFSPKNEPILFSIKDINNVCFLINKIKNQSDPISSYIYNTLDDGKDKILNSCQKKDETIQNNIDNIKKIIIKVLNKIILKDDLYNQKRFMHINLSKQTQSLINKKIRKNEKNYLNKLLLEDAYPNIISSWIFTENYYEKNNENNSLYGKLQKKNYWKRKIPKEKSPYQYIDKQKALLSDNFRNINVNIKIDDKIVNISLKANLENIFTGTKYNYKVTNISFNNLTNYIPLINIKGIKIANRLQFSLDGILQDNNSNLLSSIKGTILFNIQNNLIRNSKINLFFKSYRKTYYIRINGKLKGNLKSVLLSADTFDENGFFVNKITGQINKLENMLFIN